MPVEVVRTIKELRRKLSEARKRDADATVGFVPTMGYLHEGHLSLFRKAKEQDDIVVISIFVNPLQFGANEDFDIYPRDPERDLRMAREAGVNIVFIPDVEEMYPAPFLTKVSVSDITSRLCGASRPGHFDGVATVVLKLFHIVAPDRAYFGMKDAQQVAVIQQMVKDLNVPVEIVPCPTLREPDGLAMSSRNVYLSPEERAQAVVLNEALTEAEEALKQKKVTPREVKDLVLKKILTAPLADVDYAEVLNYPELTPISDNPQQSSRQIIIALAVRFGKTRLIDNRIISL